MGYDADLVGGYDLGMFRIEGELAYKRAGIKIVRLINPDLVSDLGDALAADYDVDADLGGGHVSALSGMVNGLFDFSQPTWGGYHRRRRRSRQGQGARRQ